MSATVALSRAYPCKGGGPVLRDVELRIFTLRYFQACMACTYCHDVCCSWGVDIDLENAARLKALPDDFKALVGMSESAWFTAEVTHDPDFPVARIFAPPSSMAPASSATARAGAA